MIKRFFKFIFGFIITIVLVAGGTVLYVNAKYDINIFTVGKSLGKLSENVDVATLAPKAPKVEDLSATKNIINASINDLISYNSETDTYSVNKSISSSISEDIKLTDTQVCVLLNWMLESQEETMKANIGGKEVDLKDYNFKLVQIAFSSGKEGAINFNLVMSISLEKIKDKMNSFPFSFFKSKVPDTLYISSTVAIKKTEGTFGYSVKSVSLALNNMTGEEVEKLFKLVNIFAKVGDLSDFNLNLGTSFVNALIGNNDVSGLTYSLKSAGVTDFDFETISDTIYYVIKK